MRVFRWTSKMLAQAMLGEIVVVAETVEEARRFVSENATTLYPPNRFHQARDIISEFEKEVSGEPREILELPAVLFFDGSA